MASITTYQDAADLLVTHVFPAASAAERTIVNNIMGFNRRVAVQKTLADAAAGTASPDAMFAAIVGKWLVTGVNFIPQTTLTGDNTNNATLLVSQFANGAALTTVASLQTTVANGNWTARTAVAITLSGTLANLVIDGSSAPVYLAFGISKGGTGVVVPAGGLEVLMQPIA